MRSGTVPRMDGKFKVFEDSKGKNITLSILNKNFCEKELNRMKKLFSVIFLAALICAIPVIAQQTKTIEKVTYVDDLNREVKIPSEITSVVTLAPSLTETLAFLDSADLIKATDSNSDYPEMSKKSQAGIPVSIMKC